MLTMGACALPIAPVTLYLPGELIVLLLLLPPAAEEKLVLLALNPAPDVVPGIVVEQVTQIHSMKWKNHTGHRSFYTSRRK